MISKIRKILGGGNGGASRREARFRFENL